MKVWVWQPERDGGEEGIYASFEAALRDLPYIAERNPQVVDGENGRHATWDGQGYGESLYEVQVQE